MCREYEGTREQKEAILAKAQRIQEIIKFTRELANEKKALLKELVSDIGHEKQGQELWKVLDAKIEISTRFEYKLDKDRYLECLIDGKTIPGLVEEEIKYKVIQPEARKIDASLDAEQKLKMSEYLTLTPQAIGFKLF